MEIQSRTKTVPFHYDDKFGAFEEAAETARSTARETASAFYVKRRHSSEVMKQFGNNSPRKKHFTSRLELIGEESPKFKHSSSISYKVKAQAADCDSDGEYRPSTPPFE